MWDNVWLLAFLIWPAVIIGAALLNMLVSWTFSWSELVMDYLIGVVIGMCFYFGMNGEVIWLEHLLLMVSLGLFGLLKWVGVSYFTDPQTLFLWSVVSIGIAVPLTGGLDRATVAIGDSTVGKKVGRGILSFFIWILKAPFTLITPGVGLLVGLIGLIVGAINNNLGFGFLGGIFYFKWGLSGGHATTFGWIVNAFRGSMSGNIIPHELYHTRQYIYLHDWLGVFYFTIAGLWGLISSAVSSDPFDVTYFWKAHENKEVGNPLERAAYSAWGP